MHPGVTDYDLDPDGCLCRITGLWCRARIPEDRLTPEEASIREHLRQERTSRRAQNPRPQAPDCGPKGLR